MPINETVFIPFIQILKNSRPDEFYATETLFHPDYFTLLYPHSKEQVLCIAKAVNRSGESRLYYFLYVFLQRKIYQWTLPLPATAAGHYSFYILEDIKRLSYWGNEFDLHDPSVTMDDPHFWDGYVFKKEDNQYKYLQPVIINNNQKDIYPLF